MNNDFDGNIGTLQPHSMQAEDYIEPRIMSPPSVNVDVKYENPTNLIDGLVSGKILDKLLEKKVKKKLETHAENVITAKIETEKNKLTTAVENTKSERDAAMFERNRVAPLLFGMDEKAEQWQQYMMRFWHDSLWVVWFIICLATIAPVMFLNLRLKTIIKNTWITAILAVAIYLAVVIVPIVLTKI